MASDKPVADVGQLAAWKVKYAALGRLIESYEEAERVGALGNIGDPVDFTPVTSVMVPSAFATSAGPFELPVGAFLNKSIPEAIKVYLAAVKKKQTVREIAVALKEGGLESTAANWETTVTGSLHRLKKAGAVLRFKDGWGFADYYPDSLRARISKDGPQPKPKARKKKRAKKVALTSTARDTTKTGPPRANKIRLRPTENTPQEKAG